MMEDSWIGSVRLVLTHLFCTNSELDQIWFKDTCT